MKHSQDDRSLQRDRLVGRGPGGLQESIRSNTQSASQADAMMNEFMQQAPPMAHMQAPSAVTMEHIRREFDSMSVAPQQRNGSPHWASEFRPGVEESARMEAAFQNQRPNGYIAEFEQYQRQAHSAGIVQRTASPMSSVNTMNQWQRPTGMRMGMGMGMGMGYGAGYGTNMINQQTPIHQAMPEQVEGKGKGKMVELDDTDWETQFAQLDNDQAQDESEADRAVEAELSDIDRSVQDTKTNHLDEFESIWEGIQAEMSTNDRNIYGDFDEDRWRHRADGLQEWDDFDSGVNMHIRDPQLGNYMFEQENPFKDVMDAFGEGVRIMDGGGNLSLAALAFEAAVQKDPQHVEAWTRLGASQAQNEKEAPAIRALEQAVKLDPTSSDALMSLAVSYTNEGYDSTAYRTLERWLFSKYPQIQPEKGAAQEADPLTNDFGFTERHILHERVTNLFIQAAQLAPTPETMDPDVQVGLGVLFYGAEEFNKAVDCFSAALASSEAGSTTSDKANQRPLLWNRLGATLANSGRSEEAIQAYEKALELNPSFVRARYNLGVSCINIGCYEEAAQHLLGALSMHNVAEEEGREKAKDLLGAGKGDGGGAIGDEELEAMLHHNQSTNLYDTLRRVFTHMGRRDLTEKVVSGMNVDDFRGEFDF